MRRRENSPRLRLVQRRWNSRNHPRCCLGVRKIIIEDIMTYKNWGCREAVGSLVRSCTESGMSFPNDVKSIIFFGKSNLELYFSAIPYSFAPDSLQVPYSLSPDWVLIGHYIFKNSRKAFRYASFSGTLGRNSERGRFSWGHDSLCNQIPFSS